MILRIFDFIIRFLSSKFIRKSLLFPYLKQILKIKTNKKIKKLAKKQKNQFFIIS